MFHLAIGTEHSQNSSLEQAGFEPSVPHLIGVIRRAIGKAADKLRKALDASTCVAESSFSEPSEPAPSAFLNCNYSNY